VSNKSFSLEELANLAMGEIAGDAQLRITGFASLEN